MRLQCGACGLQWQRPGWEGGDVDLRAASTGGGDGPGGYRGRGRSDPPPPPPPFPRDGTLMVYRRFIEITLVTCTPCRHCLRTGQELEIYCRSMATGIPLEELANLCSRTQTPEVRNRRSSLPIGLPCCTLAQRTTAKY